VQDKSPVDLIEVRGVRSWSLSSVGVPSRVAVVGAAGSGKSAFAERLSRLLGIAHVELDALFWRPGWTPGPPDSFVSRVREVVAGAEWIVDGNYYSKLGDLVLARLCSAGCSVEVTSSHPRPRRLAGGTLEWKRRVLPWSVPEPRLASRLCGAEPQVGAATLRDCVGWRTLSRAVDSAPAIGTGGAHMVCCAREAPRGKAEKYPLSDGSLHGCRVKYCSIRLFMTALP